MHDYNPVIQTLSLPVSGHIELAVLRDDVWGGPMQGNKWRKLRYNLEAYARSGKKALLTFGGAYSNHLYAIAFAGCKYGIPVRVLVRGEEPAVLSPTLQDAKAWGTELIFTGRTEYSRLRNLSPEELEKEFPDMFVVPEGGANEAGEEGCRDIAAIASAYTDICVAWGTGTTAAGIGRGLKAGQNLHIYPVLKGIEPPSFISRENIHWHDNWHFGGYARITPELLHFCLDFYHRFSVPLDPVYTGKLMYGVWQEIEQGFFAPCSRVLVYHSGGLQGMRGFPEYDAAMRAAGFSL